MKYCYQVKYATKLCVWAAISVKGMSNLFIVSSNGAINGEMYWTECIDACLITFLEQQHADGDDIFWQDFALAHYANAMNDLFQAQMCLMCWGAANPPGVPQIQPIRKFWGLLNQRIYAGCWEAEAIGQLKRRIRKCVR